MAAERFPEQVKQKNHEQPKDDVHRYVATLNAQLVFHAEFPPFRGTLSGSVAKYHLLCVTKDSDHSLLVPYNLRAIPYTGSSFPAHQPLPPAVTPEIFSTQGFQMKRLLLVLAAVSAIGCTAAAKASTIGPGTYYLDNALVDGYAVTGTVTFDSSSKATSVSLSFLDPAYSSTAINFNTITQTNAYSGLGQNYFSASNNGGGQLTIYFNNSSTNGNFNLCIGNATCGTSGGSDPSQLQVYGYNISSAPYYVPGFTHNFTSGYFSATPSVAPTPEPSSLVLLGSGMLGLVGAARRRFRKA